MKLNQTQTEAIRHKDGPMMVLAGPGSGKTMVITHRVKYLIETYGVQPGSILVVTFTKAAALQMRERFYGLTGRKLPVTFGTFHAVFFSILKYAYGYTVDHIVKEEMKYQFMRDIIYRMHLDFEDENGFISDLLSEISLIKNSDISVEHYYSVSCGEEDFRRIYAEYERLLRKHRLIDFDDMLIFTKELFEQRPDILAGWQRKYRYILIDEFQDINKIQYDIVRMLAEPRKNLFLVGDDDQSIYRFRGAKPEIMLHVPQDYPGIRQVALSVNYRSDQKIVSAAQRLIGHNTHRFEKSIESDSKNDGLVKVHRADSQRTQNLFVIQSVQKHLERGGSLNDIAVLFRTNAQPRFLMELLLQYNIPFRTKDKIPNLYDSWIAKDIFTYIRLAQGSRRRSDVLAVMNRPNRYLSRDYLDEEEVAFDVWISYYKEQPWMVKRLERLESDLLTLKHLSPYAAVNYIRKAICYDDYLKSYAEYRNISYEDLLETAEQLQEAAKSYKTMEEWQERIEQFKKELEQANREADQLKDAVSLATLHSAKGLEYEIVHIVDVNEGIMPYKKAVLAEDLEEERRMFYVGMTRAKKELHLHTTQKVNNHKMEPSRFLEETITHEEIFI